MKKVLLFTLVVFAFTSVNAQFYGGIQLGYGMGANKQALGYEQVNDNTGKNIYTSQGAGLNVGGKLGIMMDDNFGLELGVSYLLGSAQTLYKDDTELAEAKSSNLRLAPQLVTKLDNGLYSRFGIIIPVTGATIITSTDDDFMGSGVKAEMEITANGAFSVGFTGAIGYAVELSDNMDFFAELEYIGLEIKSKKSEITKMEVDGTDMLKDMDVIDIKTEYVDELDFSKDIPDSSPDQDLAGTSPFSSFGVNVGIVFKF